MVYSGFIVDLFDPKQLPAAGNNVDESGETEPKQKLWPENQNNELTDAKMLCKAQRDCVILCVYVTMSGFFHIAHNNLIHCYLKWLIGAALG